MDHDVWFVSDLHFNHDNIIEGNSSWGYRPFDSIEEMNYHLIEKWNENVASGDRVYVVGDILFAFDTDRPAKLIHQLNGQKFLIEGNHDRTSDWPDELTTHFEFIRTRYELRMDGYFEDGQHLYITLDHYPMRTWNRRPYGCSVHCHGHVHDLLKDVQLAGALDVGIDTAHRLTGEWRPLELSEVASHIGAEDYREYASGLRELKYQAAVLATSGTTFDPFDAELRESYDDGTLGKLINRARTEYEEGETQELPTPDEEEDFTSDVFDQFVHRLRNLDVSLDRLLEALEDAEQS